MLQYDQLQKNAMASLSWPIIVCNKKNNRNGLVKLWIACDSFNGKQKSMSWQQNTRANTKNNDNMKKVQIGKQRHSINPLYARRTCSFLAIMLKWTNQGVQTSFPDPKKKEFCFDVDSFLSLHVPGPCIFCFFFFCASYLICYHFVLPSKIYVEPVEG